MATEAIVQKHILQQVPIFRHLTPGELEEVGSLFRQRSFCKKKMIFTEGSEKRAVYVVKSGLVKTYTADKQGGEQIDAFLKRGEMLPQSGFFEKGPYAVTAESIVQTVLLVLPYPVLDPFLQNQPAIRKKIKRAINERLHEPEHGDGDRQDRRRQHHGQQFLLKLVEHYGTSVKGELRIGIPMTQEHFAHTIGSTREKSIVFLDQMRNAGIVEMYRSGFIIHDVESLRRWKDD